MDAPQPLAGIRVFDLTHALAGPYCTMLLGDLGADVVKLEPPGGDHARQWGPPFLNGESTYFLSVNRNKRSVVLDLKSREGVGVARELALASDVVVENFKPGTAERLGLGPERLRGSKPELIYASISGFGAEHPELAGYDQIAQGTSGIMSLTGPPDGTPHKAGVPIGDITAGMFAAHAILAALLERERGGGGRTIDVALNDSLLALLTYQAGRYFASDESPGRDGNFHATIAPYGMYATSDGFLNIAVGSDGQFRRFCEVLEAPELADDPRFLTNAKRQAARDELSLELEHRLRRRTRAEWLDRLAAAGVPAGPIHDLAEAFASPLAEAREMRLEVEHPTAGRLSQVGAPWKLDGASSPVRLPPPTLGQHTAQVLSEVLGFDAERAQALEPEQLGGDGAH
ncbi:MAG: CoA transferase [Candidatus Dormibacteraeota bacterium]|uniref:CoA transferase n=1 Tax=Candidatus Dormiibacter inghamiae TaxID=3127013 RepID=A0A934NC86_9BACT|nr:CoA transferase [Candidatus Dormibacteraeota bacterium]MBJ7607669.1 CoA transferase [Candidatus Dormibacteraeota bacterium]